VRNLSGLVVLILISLYAFACKQSDSAVKDPDKAKLMWQWRPQSKDDKVSEFRLKCGTVSGRYDLPVVRVPFPKLEVSIKQLATKPGRYFCVVTAVNQSGESGPSNEITFNIDKKGAVADVAGGEKKEAGESKTTASPAETQPYITTGDVKVRSGPGTQHKTVAEVKKGTRVNVAGREGKWLRIISKQGNPPGYIDERFAQPTGEQPKAAPGVQGSYTTTADTYVRKGPGLEYGIITKIPEGTKVHVVGGESGWLKVESKYGKPPGYIDKSYVERLPDR
jgi:uncharacterized protein YgiM (DUF1202 family)